VRLREPVPGVIRLVGGRVFDDRGCKSCKIRVGCEPLLHCGPSQASQQAKRPFEGGRSGSGVEAREKPARARLPGPSQVRRNVEEVFEPDDLLARPLRS